MKGRVCLWFLRVALVALALWVAAGPAPALAAGSPFTEQGQVPLQAGGYACFHIVARGETLTSIAARYGISVFALSQANYLSNPSLIFAGMRLRVPCVSVPQTCIQAAYLVRPGDNLFRIGLRFGVSPVAIAVLNGLRNVNLVFSGMRLAIPCRSAVYSSYGVPYAPPGGAYQPPYGAPAPGGYPPNPAPSPMPMMTPGPSTGGSVMVSMSNLMFNPVTVTIHVGQTIVWRNAEAGAIPHTATSGSCPGGVCTASPGWDSGTLNPGQTFSHTFTTAGTFSYFCRIHGAMMQGTIVVTAS